jgi:hypothetical protein
VWLRSLRAREGAWYKINVASWESGVRQRKSHWIKHAWPAIEDIGIHDISILEDHDTQFFLSEMSNQ